MRRGRRGAAAAEAAVCLPVLLTIVLASIEISNMFYVHQALQTAAYEAAMTAAKDPTATNNSIRSLVQSILATYHVEQGEVEFSTTDLTTLPAGDQVRVTVYAPFGPNRIITNWAPSWLLTSGNLVAECTALRG